MNVIDLLLYLGILIMDFADGWMSIWSYELEFFGTTYSLGTIMFGPLLLVVIQAVFFKGIKNLINPFK